MWAEGYTVGIFIALRFFLLAQEEATKEVELVTLITQGGPYALAATMAYLYWLERKERQELQKLHSALLERALVAIGAFSEAIKELKSVITGPTRP